jgi:aryl-alcohol dehydrogenase-like predicted oxidoreductase
LLSKPGVVSPVVGVSKVSQLEDLADAVAIQLEADDISYLEELYRPLDNLLSIGTS